MELKTGSPRSRPIFVLGVDRSGTSLISEILYKWGAYPGELDKLAKANEGNPQGYWEYEPMEEFVNKLFDSVKVSHWEPNFSRLMKEKAFDEALRKEALDLLVPMEKGPAWFWKEPYLSLCMGFWEEIVQDPIFIIPVRNPYESAMSYEKFVLPPNLRDSVRLFGLFFLRWQWFMLSILEAAEKNRSVCFIPYDTLMRQPVEQCDRLARFLDHECGLEGTGRDTVRRMADSINPSLYRNRSTVAFADAPQATAAQIALFELLLRKVTNPAEPFDPAQYPLAGWWREYMENFDLLLGLFNIA